ncbi:putative quinol monooxygenase [Uliginosibacterium sp. TH139]|uniref:putative quinol monooxygenase n=1 Tax=Uliginosibacterium sp. TH139 TaxID=2067453 RepID=UPI000C7C42E0|nr:putative quinol monooxygenase [Uliginosibacterium sp. TH139]PLK49685.1 antibiotic biosynthesis monooxygenase [Uliginosibacterium sp. TH139]
MEEINLLVLIEVQPGKRAIQIEAFEALRPLVLAEPGCIQYELFSDEEDENKFILVERWASQEALAAHGKTAHMLAAVARNPSFRARPASVIRMSPVGR